MSTTWALPPLAALRQEAQNKISNSRLSDLKIACGREGLTKTGRKSDLQNRLRQRLELLDDQDSVADLLQSLGGSRLLLQQPSSSTLATSSSSVSGMSHRWRESPFYKAKKVLATNKMVACQSHRNTITTMVNWSAQDLES